MSLQNPDRAGLKGLSAELSWPPSRLLEQDVVEYLGSISSAISGEPSPWLSLVSDVTRRASRARIFRAIQHL